MIATGPCAWCKTACVTAPVPGQAESPTLLRPRTTSSTLLGPGEGGGEPVEG
jgi:hypothetical protein